MSDQYDFQILRQKALEGTLSNEELREGVRMLRDERLAKAKTTHKATKAKNKNINSDAMLDELDGI